MFAKMTKTNGEPYTRRLVRTVRGQALETYRHKTARRQVPSLPSTITSVVPRPSPVFGSAALPTRRSVRGVDNLKDGREYDNLYRSAKARSEADWLVGINASQALCLSAGRGVFSLGRVQTPTLMMICNRYMENKNFTPQKYWQLRVQSGTGSITFSALSAAKYDRQDEAAAHLQQIQSSGTLQVTAAEKKEASQEPPLLYDLTALQKEANVRHGFSADKTLSIAQSLYEKKVTSYPRTGSRYISDDVFEIIPDRIRLLTSYPRFAAYAATLDGQPLNSRSVNAAKVTDHHALLVTENLPRRPLTGRTHHLRDDSRPRARILLRQMPDGADSRHLAVCRCHLLRAWQHHPGSRLAFRAQPSR